MLLSEQKSSSRYYNHNVWGWFYLIDGALGFSAFLLLFHVSLCSYSCVFQAIPFSLHNLEALHQTLACISHLLEPEVFTHSGMYSAAESSLGVSSRVGLINIVGVKIK